VGPRRPQPRGCPAVLASTAVGCGALSVCGGGPCLANNACPPPPALSSKVRYVTNRVEMARPSSLQLLTICPKDVYGRHRRANGDVDLQTATETLGHSGGHQGGVV
jgi:hypothetical protein